MRTQKSLVQDMSHSRQEAWHPFYQQYWPWLLAHARNDIPRLEDAEDICQTVLIKVLKAIPGFEYDRQKGSFRGWLLTILKHEVINFLRRRKLLLMDDLRPQRPTTRRTSRSSRIVSEPPARGPSDFELRQMEEVINLTLQRLQPQVSAEAFDMFYAHFFQGERPPFIAARFGKTLNAVYTSNSKTLRLFRSLLRDSFGA
jgi:RNA polymerase sigma-70 factor, ECF subfamily